MTPEINRFAALSKLQKTLKAELSDVNGELASLQEVVQTQFEQAGTQSMNIQGVTMYVGSSLYAKKATETTSTDDMIRVLKEAHLEEYYGPTVKTASLSAYFRRCEELGEPVPKCFTGVIDVSRKYEIKTRKSN